MDTSLTRTGSTFNGDRYSLQSAAEDGTDFHEGAPKNLPYIHQWLRNTIAVML